MVSKKRSYQIIKPFSKFQKAEQKFRDRKSRRIY